MHIFGDALIGVVGRAGQHAHPVVLRRRQPALDEEVRHRLAPADLQDLIDVVLIDRDQNVEERQDRENLHVIDEVFVILLLQGVVEIVVPGIELLGQQRKDHFQRDSGCEKSQADPILRGADRAEIPQADFAGSLAQEIRKSQPPDIPQGGIELLHRHHPREQDRPEYRRQSSRTR